MYDGKIIDFRCRPPYSDFLHEFLYADLDYMTNFSAHFGMPVPESAEKHDLELSVKEMDEAGVLQGVVPGRKYFGMDNADLLWLMDKYPNRYLCLAGVDPNLGADAAAYEIETYAVNGPCVGVVVEPGLCKDPMGPMDPRMMPIYEMCQQNELPLLMSFGGLTQLSLRYMNPIELDNVAEQFPKLKIALAHGGWPWVNEVCWLALKRPGIYLSPDLYCMGGPGTVDYVAAMNQMIPNKFLFGSAYPIAPMNDAVKYYTETLGIKEEVLPKIMYQNAVDFLGI